MDKNKIDNREITYFWEVMHNSLIDRVRIKKCSLKGFFFTMQHSTYGPWAIKPSLGPSIYRLRPCIRHYHKRQSHFYAIFNEKHKTLSKSLPLQLNTSLVSGYPRRQ
jgi:hypothetical protein